MTKPTFASVLAETQEAHTKSDLQNLAHAHTLVTKYIAYLSDIQRRIANVGNSPHSFVEGTVRNLYDEAQRAVRIEAHR